jgi:hypothetical protein
VYVGNAERVGVADGGNQTMVAVWGGVCVAVGMGVAVGRVVSRIRQASKPSVAVINDRTRKSFIKKY